jgi:hypothetical protein
VQGLYSGGDNPHFSVNPQSQISAQPITITLYGQKYAHSIEVRWADKDNNTRGTAFYLTKGPEGTPESFTIESPLLPPGIYQLAVIDTSDPLQSPRNQVSYEVLQQTPTVGPQQNIPSQAPAPSTSATATLPPSPQQPQAQPAGPPPLSQVIPSTQASGLQSVFGLPPPLNQIGDFIQNELKGATDTLVRALTAMLSNNGNMEPEGALARATEVVATAMGLNFGIYALATSTDLLDPIRGTGIVPTAIDLVQKLGTREITGSIASTWATDTLNRPLSQYFNSISRPTRPNKDLADLLSWRGLIDEGTWRKYMTYLGYPDYLIDSLSKARYKVSSERLLIELFADPDIDPDWIKEQIANQGFSPQDTDMLVKWGLRKSIQSERSALATQYLSMFKYGYYDELQIKDALKLVNFTDAQITLMIERANLEFTQEVNSSKVATLKDAYTKDVITREEAKAQLEQIILASDRVEALLGYWDIVRVPAPRKSKSTATAATSDNSTAAG